MLSGIDRLVTGRTIKYFPTLISGFNNNKIVINFLYALHIPLELTKERIRKHWQIKYKREQKGNINIRYL